MGPEFSHLDPDGKVRMVDVGDKQITRRDAVAEAVVRMSAPAYTALRSGQVFKGDALAAARLAGIQAAKRTSGLIPLCHPVPLDAVDVEVEFDPRGDAGHDGVRGLGLDGPHHGAAPHPKPGHGTGYRGGS